MNDYPKVKYAILALLGLFVLLHREWKALLKLERKGVIVIDRGPLQLSSIFHDSVSRLGFILNCWQNIFPFFALSCLLKVIHFIYTFTINLRFFIILLSYELSSGEYIFFFPPK